ncbi:MAG: preprotein translocase subunit SecG [Eubacteriaceae bacterium]|nr:preprotein translocase subunit SecG [Eubacteriaceae bacterium]
MTISTWTNILIALIIVSSFALIASILLTPAKTSGMGTIEGGAETLFGKKKARGFQAILEKAIIVSAIVFMLSAFVYNVIS